MNIAAHFELLLCTSNPELAKDAIDAGADAIIVEWEDINDLGLPRDLPGKANLLQQVRRVTPAWIITRLSGEPENLLKELDLALEIGTDEVWIPKICSAKEVRNLMARAGGRCEFGAVFETEEAVAMAAEFGALPLRHLHVGLTDLAESLQKSHPFEVLADGHLEDILQTLQVPFSFGGLTLPHLGNPIPCRLILGEMVRLNCRFGILRESFLRDCKPWNLAEGISAIRKAIKVAARRTSAEVENDTRDLRMRILDLLQVPTTK